MTMQQKGEFINYDLQLNWQPTFAPLMWNEVPISNPFTLIDYDKVLSHASYD